MKYFIERAANKIKESDFIKVNKKLNFLQKGTKRQDFPYVDPFLGNEDDSCSNWLFSRVIVIIINIIIISRMSN